MVYGVTGSLDSFDLITVQYLERITLSYGTGWNVPGIIFWDGKFSAVIILAPLL